MKLKDARKLTQDAQGALRLTAIKWGVNFGNRLEASFICLKNKMNIFFGEH